ncbi:MAG: PQQ-binding-like beta-propeller repeat protein [Planctomycetota bacterium]
MQMSWMRRWGIAGWLCVLSLACGLPAAAQSASVTIDDQPTTEQNLARINDLRRASRHAEAADLLQELIDAARFKIVTVDGGLYIDAELWAQRELSRDPLLLSAYRERFTPSAERALALAREGADAGATSLGEFREAYRRFGMTRPGLEAGLVLVSRLLERGDVAAASALIEVLARHPDQSDAGGRVVYMRGVCAALRGDSDEADAMVALLRLTDVAQAEQLLRFQSSVSLPMAGSLGGLVDAGPTPQGLATPLWDTPLGVTAERSRPSFDGLHALPIAYQEQVLVNARDQVVSLDRASGQQLWAYPEEVGRSPGFAMNLPEWLDTRGVAVSQGRLFGVLGACRGGAGRGGAEVVPPNRLVCLDPRTGEAVWSRQSGEIAAGEPLLEPDMRGVQSALLQTHFVGTPVATQGKVFVLVRKTSATETGLHTTWLAAFDAHDGRLHWFRHIALVQVRHGPAAGRVTPQLMLNGDTLYLTDQIAVAASIDVHSGAYRWLRVLADDRTRRRNSLTLTNEGMHAAPVLTPAGLVVQLSLYEQQLFLLDPATGKTLRTMQDDARLRGALYTLDADGAAVIVTRSYVVYWDGEDGEVQWVYPLEQGAQPRGQGAVTKQFVMIPTVQGLAVLRLSDGTLIAETEGITGNLAALDTEVLVAANGSLQSYMSWDGAYARLVRRVEQNPADPGPGMSLAYLALDRGEHDDTVIEGVGFALAAIDRMDDASVHEERERVFEGMRVMADIGSPASDALRDRLFDFMAEAAQSATQSAAYHIERGKHLVSVGSYEQAVRHFQSVMVDPALAAAAYRPIGSSASSPAGGTAQRTLVALVDEHGRGIYQRYDALAKQELETLIARGNTDPELLSRIAQRYPLALSASRALMAAAAHLEAAGQPIGALCQYQQALASAMTGDQQQAAAGALLSYYEKTRRRAEAMSLLTRLTRESSSLRPQRGGEPTPLDQWREVFLAIEARDDLALDPPSALASPVVLPGRLLLPPPGLHSEALNGSLLIHTAQGQVAWMDATGRRAKWTAHVAGRQLYVLAVDSGQVLVWSVDGQALVALDSETGETLWNVSTDLSDSGRLPAEGHVGQAAPGRMLPEELPFVSVGPSVVCFTSRAGHVVGIDRYRGTLRWSVDTGIPHVTAITADPWTLAVAGVMGPELDLRHGKIVLLDLYTGSPALEHVDLHVGFMPQVVGLDAGRLVVVGQDGARVTAFDAATGETQWQQSLSDKDATPNGIVHGSVVAVENEAGMVQVMHLNEPVSVVSRFRIALEGQTGHTQMHRMGDGLLIFGEQGVVAVGSGGSVAWRSAPHVGGGAVHQALAGDARIARLASIDTTGDPNLLLAQGQAVSYRIDLISRETGLLERTYTLGPIQGQLDPRRAAITHAGLAIAMGPQTLLVPPADQAGSGVETSARRR